MSTNDFIDRLQKKGIYAQVNVATTGYVSSISFSYQGYIITDSKLGNDFKWTTLLTVSLG